MPQKKATLRPKKGKASACFHGRELHAKVIEAAEAEVEERYVKCWTGQPTAYPRPLRGDWRRHAREFVGPSNQIAWNRRYNALRNALVKALCDAKEDRDVWLNLVDECPELAPVSLDDRTLVFATDAEAGSLSFRMARLSPIFGPTWRIGALPTHRDLALQIVLSGWICDGWSASMTVSKAIEAVVSAVRTHRREHPSPIPK